MLNREKYTGIYRVGDNVYDKLYPPIVSADVFQSARKRLFENGVGKHVPDVTYLLRGKIDCGYCGKRLTSSGGKDRYGTQRRYYTCYLTKHCSCKPVKKELLEDIVISALHNALCSPENIELLISSVLDSIDKKNSDNVTLHILEKEYEQTEKAIANIMNAIKMGILTETTKQSLEDCENTKRELSEKIFAERAKIKPRPARDQIRNYILSALKKPTKQMIDLLIHKIVIFNDKIEITFKYIQGSPDDERPIKLNKHITKNRNPDTTRGSLFTSFSYPYTETKNHITFDKTFQVEIYV